MYSCIVFAQIEGLYTKTLLCVLGVNTSHIKQPRLLGQATCPYRGVRRCAFRRHSSSALIVVVAVVVFAPLLFCFVLFFSQMPRPCALPCHGPGEHGLSETGRHYGLHRLPPIRGRAVRPAHDRPTTRGHRVSSVVNFPCNTITRVIEITHPLRRTSTHILRTRERVQTPSNASMEGSR